MTEPHQDEKSLAATSGREAQPRDRSEVAESAETAERIDGHGRKADDSAGIGTGSDDAGGARTDDR